MPASEHVASASVKVGGNRLEMERVERIEVRTFVGLPDVATVRVSDPEGDDLDKHTYKIGDQVEISLGALEATAPAPVFVGEIVAYDFEYTTSSAYTSLRAYDQSHRMNRNRRSATFQGMTVSDVVKKVLSGCGLDSGGVEATSTVHPFLQQSMESDLDFVKRLAAMENCEFGMAAGKAFLRRRHNGSGPVPRFAWRENVVSFKPRMTAAQQPDKVRVVNYDPVKKAAVVGEATAPGAIPPVAQEVREQAKTFGSSELVVSDRIVTTADEARTLAQSTLDTLASSAWEADAEMRGDPGVKAGGKIKLEGFGSKFDGEKVVTSVTHVYGHGDFRTRFAISGRNPRTITDLLRPKPKRDWTSGLVIGIVTNINDELELGRVRIKFPSLGDSVEGTWARIALPNAGKESGMAFLPQVGDEVAVAFEHGDPRRPVVLGALHNSVDKPHQKMRGEMDGGSLVVYGRRDAEINLQKQFVIAAKEHMVITIARGDAGAGDYKLETEDKIEVKAGSTITIEGTGDVTIKSSAGVTVEASGSLKLKGATVDVEAGATLNLKGSLINIG
jgi:uncharacterized protein involved in type VI secretion and phage assembly